MLRRLLKQRTDPLQGAGRAMEAGAGAETGSQVELWLLGPKNPFCRFTWDETVGPALCGWEMERLMRSRDMSFLWSQTY